MKKIILSSLALLLLNTKSFSQKDKQPTITMESISERCKGADPASRVTLKVARFTTAVPQAQGRFGGELATMLSNALQETSCFRVIEMNRNMSDATDEGGDIETAALTVTAEITEFAEGNSTTKFAGVSVGSNKAKVGFVLKVLNPQNSEILFSKSVNMEGTSSGFKGLKLFGVETAGTTENKALQDAIEKAIIKAVDVLVTEKHKMIAPVSVPVKRFDASNCLPLKNGRGPKIMILLTEAQTVGGPTSNQQYERQKSEAEREHEIRKESIGLLRDLVRSSRNTQAAATAQPQQQSANANAINKPVVIEQATSENALIKRFIEAGFRVIDPKVYDQMRKENADLGNDISKMATLGLKMGANIIITGTALSERTVNNDGLFSFRGRVELRALTTDDATILATHTAQAGAVDVAESVASKKSLQNASDKMATYLFEQLCSRNLVFADTGSSSNAAQATAGGTEIKISNVSFAQLQSIMAHLKTNNKVGEIKKTLSGSNGSLVVNHKLSTDQIAEILSACKTVAVEITGLEGERIEAKIK